jgi:hypothetical protein
VVLCCFCLFSRLPVVAMWWGVPGLRVYRTGPFVVFIDRGNECGERVGMRWGTCYRWLSVVGLAGLKWCRGKFDRREVWVVFPGVGVQCWRVVEASEADVRASVCCG